MEFDIAMPAVLFFVTLVATFLSKKVEGKLKNTFQERELRIRDVVMLVVSISVVVSIVVFVPQIALMALFLFSYSMLLFVFTFLFSDFKKTQSLIFHVGFVAITFVAATISLLASRADINITYGSLALYGLFGFALVALAYDQGRVGAKERWYAAVLPPALFIVLYLFYSRTHIWFPYLLDLYGVVFAILIILYIGSMFTWKTTLFFAIALTAVDIFLVLVTGSMVSAAKSVTGLRLPVLIGVPIIPVVATEGALHYMSLGLGDFFFAGILATQTWKKFGANSAILALAAMPVSFFVFEAFLLTYGPTAFPGTLMILCGWLPIVLVKSVVQEKASEEPSREKSAE